MKKILKFGVAIFALSFFIVTFGGCRASTDNPDIDHGNTETPDDTDNKNDGENGDADKGKDDNADKGDNNNDADKGKDDNADKGDAADKGDNNNDADKEKDDNNKTEETTETLTNDIKVSVTLELQSDISDIKMAKDEKAGTVTLTAPSGYTSYVWRVDGTLQNSASNKNALTLNVSELYAGLHHVFVMIDNMYSSTIILSIEK